MKPIRRSLTVAVFALTFVQCKSVAPTGPASGKSPSVLEVSQLLDSAQIVFLQMADAAGGDPKVALDWTQGWMVGEPNIDYAYTVDSSYLCFATTSGLPGILFIDRVDAAGHALFRGSPEGGNRLEEFVNALEKTPASKHLTNKHVLLFLTDTFALNLGPQLQRTLAHINASPYGLDATVLQAGQCNYTVPQHFADYGLVILDTHGDRDAFELGSKLDFTGPVTNEEQLKELVESGGASGAYNSLAAAKLALGVTLAINTQTPNWQKSTVPVTQRSIWYKAPLIRALPQLSNTIVFGNMCYSGYGVISGIVPATIYRDDKGRPKIGDNGDTLRWGPRTIRNPDAIRPAFLSLNPIAYYGYVFDQPKDLAREVTDGFAIQMEDSLVTRLVDYGDSTGVINLKPDNVTEYYDPQRSDLDIWFNLYCRRWGSPNYSYQTDCVDTFTDARDGHLYHAVCIGSQNWMSENLDYNAPGSITYNNDPANEAKYGRLYSWATLMNGASASSTNPSGVQGICPKGWHVPSASEYQQLIAYLGGPGAAGGALKSTTGWMMPNLGATNSSGFSALPAGEFYANGFNRFTGLDSLAAFWSASIGAPGFYQVYFLMSSQSTIAAPGATDQYYMSCHCLKDP